MLGVSYYIMGNACAGPQGKQRAAEERRQEAALSLASTRGGFSPVATPQAVLEGPPAAHPARADEALYEAQLQQALRQSQVEAGQEVLPPGEEDAAMVAAIAASEQDAERMRMHAEDNDAELQAALRASQQEMSALPREFIEGAQPSDPFADDPFGEPQPQPTMVNPQRFDVFAELKNASTSPGPKRSPEKTSLSDAGDQLFGDFSAPLQQAVEWVGTVLQRDFSEYIGGADDTERGANIMNFVSCELQDGVLLCLLLNTLFPGTVPNVDESGSDDATAKNFEAFSVGCRAVGVPADKVFTFDDLTADFEVVAPFIKALQGLRPTASATPI